MVVRPPRTDSLQREFFSSRNPWSIASAKMRRGARRRAVRPIDLDEAVATVLKGRNVPCHLAGLRVDYVARVAHVDVPAVARVEYPAILVAVIGATGFEAGIDRMLKRNNRFQLGTVRAIVH